ncbi:MAG: HAD-IIIC family phosphatase [Planctomycetes bacterium]|nr:HAD-IIIC family phosphatase [Planctomycetota bacterium]
MNTAIQVLASVLDGFSNPPTTIEIARATKLLGALDAEQAGLKPLKVGIVSSFTFDPLARNLVIRGYVDGFRIDPTVSPFGQYIQELVSPNSALANSQPDVVVVAVRLQDSCPALYERFNELDAASNDAIVTEWQENFRRALVAFRRHFDAPILCCNYEQPAHPSMGLADARSPVSQRKTITAMNRFLDDLVVEIGSFHVVDIDNLAGRVGRARWQDPKLWYWGRIPIATENQWAYVGEIVRVLRATAGKARKVLALDCDNTLWGGVLGDVGRDGIALGHDYPGNAFVALQKRALDLYHRGVVLVVASKNEHSAVLDVFENHPEMVLRPKHISAFAVNWDPKPQNLQQVAAKLNLNLDSFVFVDDHPVECAMMREMVPSVKVVHLPQDPAQYERTLASLDCFDQLSVSEEDRQRGEMYRREARRAEFRAEADGLESFYAGLNMQMTIAVNDESTIARVAQLTQRTNQFNMTTRRRTESEILDLMRSQGVDVCTARLIDRFGDNGIVGLAIVGRDSHDAVLDTFLMSCRVLGRTVESSFLAWIGCMLREAGIRTLEGQFVPTSKNKPFADFYASWGMSLKHRADDGAERWTYDLEESSEALTIPPWIKVETLA